MLFKKTKQEISELVRESISKLETKICEKTDLQIHLLYEEIKNIYWLLDNIKTDLAVVSTEITQTSLSKTAERRKRGDSKKIILNLLDAEGGEIAITELTKKSSYSRPVIEKAIKSLKLEKFEKNGLKFIRRQNESA